MRPTRTKNPFRITDKQKDYILALSPNWTRQQRCSVISKFLNRQVHSLLDLSMAEASVVIMMVKDYRRGWEGTKTLEEYWQDHNQYRRLYSSK